MTFSGAYAATAPSAWRIAGQHNAVIRDDIDQPITARPESLTTMEKYSQPSHQYVSR